MKWPYQAGFVIVLAISACNSSDHPGNAAAGSDLLARPPYESISDSIRSDPKNALLYQERASRLMANARYELAEADLERAWQLAPSQALAEQHVSNLFLMGKNEAARKLLTDMVATYPDNLTLKRRLGETYLQQGQYGKAIETFDAVIAADSLDFEAYNQRASLFLQRNDTASAIADLEKSIRLQPLLMTTLTLANIYAEKKNPRALELTGQVMARDSANEMVDPVFIQGIYYANTGNTAKALDRFNQCIRIDWKFQEVYIEKGIIYFDQKNIDEAMQQFKLAATVSNTYADAYFWQGRCYEALGKKEDALSNYMRAYALDNGFEEARVRIEKLRVKP
ncbi:MAG: tetratricopeptide repeat protein [Flavihumibacter sp.]